MSAHHHIHKTKQEPLSTNQIMNTGIDAQMWFAKQVGSAPADWSDEQIRTHASFQAAVVQLVRAVEAAHGID